MTVYDTYGTSTRTVVELAQLLADQLGLSFVEQDSDYRGVYFIADAGPYRFAEALHPVVSVPPALNGYALWVGLMIALTVTNYGYPILQLAVRSDTAVQAVYVGGSR